MISTFRRFAQVIRHAPMLRSLNPVWNMLRKPYLQLLNTCAKRKGILVSVGSYRMRIHPDFATQDWETIEFESYSAFASLVKPGDVVFDIGAHIGTYTLLALQKVGNRGHVVAYEPHAFTRNYLNQHLVWNGVTERTTVRGLCCGLTQGTASFYCRSDQAEGTNSLIPTDGFEKKTIPVTTLDNDVEVLGLIPTVIKIDVEGAEWDVLRGAAQTISNYHPMIFLSLHPVALSKLGVATNQVFEWLADNGYRHEIISQDHEIHVIASKD